MGCQQSDTVVTTESRLSSSIEAIVPVSIPAGDEHPAAQSAVDVAAARQGQLSLVSVRTPTVWTTQSLALEVLPGSPMPVRMVAEPLPAPAEPVAVVEYKQPARLTTAAAPAPTVAAAPPTTAAPPPVVPAAATVAAAPSAAGDIAARTNSVRAGRGVAALARDGSLDSAAVGWALELATSGVLRHSSLPQQLLGKPWSTLGENVGFGASSAVVHDALVNSASHLGNIVNPSFTRIGVGAATDVNGRVWVVELFAG
ncbi:MAG: CAP domain-containing protein [Acidimicrobiales bacterium]